MITRTQAHRLRSCLALIFIFMVLASSQAVRAIETGEPIPAILSGSVIVTQSTRSDISPELRSLQPIASKQTAPSEEPPEVPNFVLPKALRESQPPAQPALVAPEVPAEPEKPAIADQMPAPLLNLDGVSNLFGGWPPDTQGDIGLNHYIQWINMHFAVWEIDRLNPSATLVYGPVPGKTLFQGFGGACATSNDGDPITLFDPFDNRWFMSQFALPNYPNGPFYQCVAVSVSSNPLGAWYRYEFQMPVDKMNDYPKFGVWPNAYFMTVNQFNAGSLSWGGAGVAALERSAMLIGAPARMVFIDLYNVNPDFGGILPADFDGLALPPVNTPGIMAEWDDASWLGSQDALRVWQFTVDWAHPDEAVFGLNGQPNWIIPTLDVDPSMCNMQRNCIPQPGTSNRVDAISDRLMHRLQYRNFGGYASLVTNHTIDVNGLDHAGIHWFELRKQAIEIDWGMFQQGIYSPDADQRWMGSAALDHVGNLALGYSLSSGSVYPSVRYTGRLAGDPLGTLPQGEQSLVVGSGAQTLSNRWGDYSMMGVDPVDDCTFWYTQEYVMTTGTNTWKTRIGSFKFPTCTIGPQGQLAGTVTDQSTSDPIQNAQVRASLSLTQTFATQTNSSGDYLIFAPVGIYTVTASAYGYFPLSESGVSIAEDAQTIRNYALELAPSHVISGTVRDANTGSPLYARITPLNTGASPVWSDPETGHYSLSLPEGNPFTLLSEAYLPGYLPLTIPVAALTSDTTLNLDLHVDQEACSAPGYSPQITPGFATDFEASNGGLSTNGTTSWAWGEILSGPGLAHSGLKGWATNLNGNYQNNENGYLNLPPLDLSAYAGQQPALSWQQYLYSESRYDYASIEASKDGGSSWQAIYGPLSGLVDSTWKYHYLPLDASYAVSNLLIRFHFYSDYSITYPGWYIDDLIVGIGDCIPQAGGLVVGNVLDANTLAALNAATVVDDLGDSTAALPTPDDPDLADGFYMMFAPEGAHVFTATYPGSYQADEHLINVPQNGVIGQDFLLQAGRLSYAPDGLDITLELGDSLTRSLQLENQGGVSAEFELLELNGGFLPSGPFEQPNFGVKSFKADLPDSQAAGAPPPPGAAPLQAGQVIQSWVPTGVINPWAVAFDALNETVWVSSPAPLWSGDDHIYEFTPSGSSTGRSYLHSIQHASGPADLAYNWNTGNIWVMNVNTGIANCIYELDPDQGYTGEAICPGGGTGFSTSQRGLAYDPDTDTWFAGGWNDLMIHRFDSSGSLLSSVNVGLAISGLAYNPDTQHLFAMINASQTRVYVLDAADNYAILGSFGVNAGFGSFAGAGLEFDCDGNLWAVDLTNDKVAQFTSGESSGLCKRDIPWINTQPVSGTLPDAATQPITVTFDASIDQVEQPGLYTMQIKVREDTPYIVANLPVSMTVTAPAGWGKLRGLVESLGYCDADPHPLEDAQVSIQSSIGDQWDIPTDASGNYQRWVDSSSGPFTVTVSAADHIPITTSAVQVTGGITTTLDLDLFWQKPCLQAAPLKLEAAIKFGRSSEAVVSLQNSGNGAATYAWHETNLPPAGYVDLDWISVLPASGSLDASGGAQQSTISLNAGAASITQPGLYRAGLALESDDPLQSLISIPITLTVLPLEYGVQVSQDLALQDIPGQMVTYTFAITNTSEGLTDTLLVALGLHNWMTSPAAALVGPLASGSQAQVSFTVSIPSSAMPGDADQVEVLVSSQGDPAKTDSITLATTALDPLADLELSLTSPLSPIWAGQHLTYTAVITNQGATKAPDTIYILVLSPKLVYLSDDAGCGLNGTVLVCQLGTLAVGEARQVRITAIPLQLGLLLSQAGVTSDASDPNPADNFVSLVGQVLGRIYFFPLVAR